MPSTPHEKAWGERQDEQWRPAYEAWWCEHRWQQGAGTPEVAWRKYRSIRR